MLYLHQPANVIPLGTRKIEFTPQIKSLPYLPQIKGAFCYGLGEPQFAIDEYGRHAPPREGAPFLVANGDLELANIDGGPVIVEDQFNHRDAYLILENMDHISIVDEALRENPLAMDDMPDNGQPSIVNDTLHENPPAVHDVPDNGQPSNGTPVGGRVDHRQRGRRGSSRASRRPSIRGRRQRRGRGLLGAAQSAGATRAVSQRSTRPRAEQVEVVSAVALAAVRVMACPARDTPAVPEVPEYVRDTFGDSADLRDQWLRWIQHP